jgi:CheY-like chemotaxis protein
LVAEDVPSIQMLLAQILRGGGHSVDIVPDGLEAVRLARQGQFDLVLMDVQMPNMDGLAATAAIRELPHKRPLPIVAMTARRIPGDREKCLAAGMDFFLAKPIDGPKLLVLIDELTSYSPASEKRTTMNSEDSSSSELQRAGSQRKTQGQADPGPTSSIFDIQGTLKRLGGDRALLTELVKLYREDSPQLLGRLIAGAEAKDCNQVQRAAHSLRGLASNFGAAEVIQPLQQLEDLAIQGKCDEFLPLIHRMEQAKARLDEALEPYC